MSAHDSLSPAKSVLNISKWLEASTFNAFHALLFLLGLGTFTFDGYCLFVYGAAVPLLLKPFQLNLTQAGVIGSYAPIGASLGALIFGALADKIGRKRTILFGIAIFCIGMGLSGISPGPVPFSIFRLITGIGVGACMPNFVSLATEYAPLRARSTIVSMMLSGIQVGGIMAALLGLWLFTPFGWRSVFIAGFVPILLFPVYLKYLPESPVFLIKHGRLDQLRRTLRRIRPNETLPDDMIFQSDLAPEKPRLANKTPVQAIFMEGRAFSTVMFWVMYFLNLYTIYGFTIWLPKLVMNQGYSLASGLTGLLILSVVSILASYLAGIIADRILGNRLTLFLFYVLAFFSIMATGYATHLWSLMVCVSLAGAGFNGAQNCLNAYIALYYPPRMRSTAMGFCYGIGRMGSILGPTIIGFLMSLHFSYHGTLLAIAIPGLIPALAVCAIRERYNYAAQIASQMAITDTA